MVTRLIKTKVICSVCNKLRIVHWRPVSKEDKKNFLKELKEKPYVCSDHKS